MWVFTVFKIEQLKRMKQKGVYPYDYTSSVYRFKDTQLRSKDADFCSILTDEGIVDESYSHAQNVWKGLQVKVNG